MATVVDIKDPPQQSLSQGSAYDNVTLQPNWDTKVYELRTNQVQVAEDAADHVFETYSNALRRLGE